MSGGGASAVLSQMALIFSRVNVAKSSAVNEFPVDGGGGWSID
jgi:hypothetical protein